LTEKGRLGIANKDAKVGDMVCVLLGYNMPLIVRKAESQQKESV
jgi:hypothetical protein